jgi:adenylate cyclase
MGLEIERKFLVNREIWSQVEKPDRTFYRQGYILNEKEKNIRVRVSHKQGFITIKGGSKGISRKEYEYEIPLEDAHELIANFAEALVEKTRYRVRHGGLLWEVDEFSGENEGLLMAEVELTSETEQVDIPDWVTEEVTGDERYYNSYLVRFPFKNWKTQ